MNKMITALAAVTVALIGLAGRADAATPPAASAAPPSKTSVTYSSQTVGGSALAENPNVPGATGLTIVPGDNSTINDDMEATRLQQIGKVGGH
jgi:hypothetical protein